MAGAGDEILIARAFLETLSANARTAATALQQCSDYVNLDFAPNHEVTEAFDNFTGGWRKRRQSLQEGLDSVAQAFTDTCQAFMTADSDLAAAVRGQEGTS